MGLELNTERLILEPLQGSDWELVVELYTDPRVVGGFGREPYSQEELEAKRHQLFQEWAVGKFSQHTVRTKAGEEVGLGGIRPTTDPKIGEIGYVFLPKWWGQGFATEAIGAWTEWGFQDLSLLGIAVEGVENPASIRALEKWGYEVTENYTNNGRECCDLLLSSSTWRLLRSKFSHEPS